MRPISHHVKTKQNSKGRFLHNQDSLRRSFFYLFSSIAWTSGELFKPLFIILGLTIFGVTGYVAIEGWSVFDSLYMTVITLSTTGFLEVHEMSSAGRAFTMVLLMMGVAIVAGVFAFITQKVVQHQFSQEYIKKRTMDTINALRNHTIVCGYGRLARIVAEELSKGSEPVVVIEQDPVRAAQVQEDGHLVLNDDASQEEVLRRANIQSAKHIISLLPKDAENLYVIMTAKELAPSVLVISRAEDEKGEKRLKRAGADKILSPYRVGGQKIADGILKPLVSHFLEQSLSGTEHGLEIEEIRIPENSPLITKSLQDAAFRKRTNVIVAAIIKSDNTMLFNPSATTLIEPGTTFIALGARNDLKELESILLQG